MMNLKSASLLCSRPNARSPAITAFSSARLSKQKSLRRYVSSSAAAVDVNVPQPSLSTEGHAETPADNSTVVAATPPEQRAKGTRNTRRTVIVTRDSANGPRILTWTLSHLREAGVAHLVMRKSEAIASQAMVAKLIKAVEIYNKELEPRKQCVKLSIKKQRWGVPQGEEKQGFEDMVDAVLTVTDGQLEIPEGIEDRKVGSKTEPRLLAAHIVRLFDEGKPGVALNSVGSVALYASLMALAIASPPIKREGGDFFFVPSLYNREEDGKDVKFCRLQAVFVRGVVDNKTTSTSQESAQPEPSDKVPLAGVANNKTTSTPQESAQPKPSDS